MRFINTEVDILYNMLYFIWHCMFIFDWTRIWIKTIDSIFGQIPSRDLESELLSITLKCLGTLHFSI